MFTPLFAFPVSYELTILLGAFATLGGMLALNRLPKLYNPLFKSERFNEAVKYFELVKNKFPYSKYAVLAELHTRMRAVG